MNKFFIKFLLVILLFLTNINITIYSLTLEQGLYKYDPIYESQDLNKFLEQQNDINYIFTKGKQKGKSLLSYLFSTNLNTQTIDIIISKNININIKNELDGATPVMHIFEKAFVDDNIYEIIIYKLNKILEKNPDLNVQDNFGRTALMHLILEFNVHSHEDSLKNSINHLNYLISSLIDNGADIFLKDKNNETALDYLKNGYYFEKSYFEYFYYNELGGNTLLNIYKKKPLTRSIKLSEFSTTINYLSKVDYFKKAFIIYSKDKDIKNFEKQIIDNNLNIEDVFNKACEYNLFEILNLCIEKNINLNKVNSEGDTQLILAIYSENYNLAKYLLGKGVDTNEVDKIIIRKFQILDSNYKELANVYNKIREKNKNTTNELEELYERIKYLKIKVEKLYIIWRDSPYSIENSQEVKEYNSLVNEYNDKLSNYKDYIKKIEDYINDLHKTNDKLLNILNFAKDNGLNKLSEEIEIFRDNFNKEFFADK